VAGRPITDAPEEAIAAQMVRWAVVAASVVTLASALVGLWDPGWSRWLTVGLNVLWSLCLVAGARRSVWLGVAAVVAVAQLGFFGWMSAGCFILQVAAFAMRFPLRGALTATASTWLTASIAVALLSHLHPPGYHMKAYQLLLATTNTFLLGALMRSALLSKARAESLAEQLRGANEMLRRDLQATEALATAQERARIARELHDSLGHSLATAHVHTQLVRKLARAGDDEIMQAIDQVGTSTRQAMHALRDAVALLRPQGSGSRLHQRLEELLDRLPTGVLAHTLSVTGVSRALSPAKEFALYRAVQEAITNVITHAHATTIEIQLHYGERAVTIDIADDGEGVAHVHPGFGLRGMAERLESVGGYLEITSAVGQGFHLRLEVAS